MQRSKTHQPAEHGHGGGGHSPQMARMVAGVRAAGLKLTPQRLAIVRELAEDESHPTAQELFERLRPSLPTMSFATVYNTLDALTAAGLCATLALSPGSGRFDPNMDPHHHLVCDHCGSVRDLLTPDLARPAAVGSPKDDSVRRAIAKVAPGFEVRSVERIMRGRCAACATVSGRRPEERRERRERRERHEKKQ
jgi:Fe2+ or Zn2+ uptake regulation protein